MVELQPSKLVMRVRFPSPALGTDRLRDRRRYEPLARVGSSAASDPLNGLTGDIRDELEMLVIVQDGEL